MVTGILPADGGARLGAVPLLTERRILSTGDAGNRHNPVAWATSTSVPDAGLAWSARSDPHPVTGLVPVLLARCGRLGAHPQPVGNMHRADSLLIHLRPTAARSHPLDPPGSGQATTIRVPHDPGVPRRQTRSQARYM